MYVLLRRKIDQTATITLLQPPVYVAQQRVQTS